MLKLRKTEGKKERKKEYKITKNNNDLCYNAEVALSVALTG